jgi:hypothetical protein
MTIHGYWTTKKGLDDIFSSCTGFASIQVEKSSFYLSLYTATFGKISVLFCGYERYIRPLFLNTPRPFLVFASRMVSQ